MSAVRRPSLELIVRDPGSEGMVASSLIARIPTPEKINQLVEFARRNQAPRPLKENFFREERRLFGRRLIFNAAAYEKEVRLYRKTVTEEDITGFTTKDIVFSLGKVLTEILDSIESQSLDELLISRARYEDIFLKTKRALISILELGSFQRPATTLEGESRQKRRLTRSSVLKLFERLNRMIHVSRLFPLRSDLEDRAILAQLAVGYKLKAADLQLFVTEIVRIIQRG